MTEYQKTYIELKKQFVATNEGPDNVRALYTFKEELEQSEDQKAKEVLVDVYDRSEERLVLLVGLMGVGSSNSNSSWLMAAGTAPCCSNQYFATAISSGVSGHSFQFPKGR